MLRKGSSGFPGADCWRRLRRSQVVRRLRHRCEYFGMLWLSKGIPRLPRAAVLRLATVAGWVGYWVDRRGRKLALENLSLAVRHGGLELGGRSTTAVVRACYQNFARNFLDLFWFAGIPRDRVWDWIDVDGAERLERSLADGRGAIHITPHFGLFELTSLTVGFLGQQLQIVARDFRNPRLTKIFAEARGSSGHRTHHRDGVMLRLLRALRRGEHVAMLTDLAVPPQGAATLIRQFGVRSSVTALHVELSKRCDAPIVAAVCEPTDDGRAKLRLLDIFSPPGDEDRRGSRAQRCEMTQRIWDVFEVAIRRRPEMWLWMYPHWRYRPAGPVGEDDAQASAYPGYAIPNAEFGKLCRIQVADDESSGP